MNSQELFERSQKVAPGGVHSPVRAFKSVGGNPIFFKKAEGAYLTSVEDKKYVDFCMSFGPALLGHRDPEVTEVVHQTVDTAWTFGTCEPYSLELAEWITQNLSFVEKLRFVSSGTEAVMSALRVAKAATKRPYILKFDGCYHGHADSMLVKSGSGLAGEASSDSAGVTQQTASETLVAPLDNEEALEMIFQKHGSEIAAVIIEPLPANYGLLIQRKEFLDKMVSLARKHGALIIFDEVISGFRVALGGMAQVLGVKPDLVTYGKVIGGGFPVGCYGGRRDLMDLVAPSGPVYQAGTLSANPVGMRAGLATLKKVKSLDLYTKLNARAEGFAKKLNAEFAKNALPLQIVQEASLFWIHDKTEKPIRTIAQIPAEHKQNFAKFFHNCLDQGIYLAPSGFEVGFLSWAHTDAILDEVCDSLIRAAKKVHA
jgi:glutamate-1-semialdehyde 2,1-aminomutase